MLKIVGLGVQVGKKNILSDIEFTLHKNEIITVIGPNGSGKTTLLRTIIGAISPSRGSVELTSGTKLGYVPQKLHLEPSMPMTVKRFMNLPKANPKAIQSALKQTSIEHLSQHDIGALSGGQLQRVLLAKSLINDPDILLLDEPTQGLDHKSEAAFYRQIEQIRQLSGRSIIMVSHDLHTVMKTSDRVICLNGNICCQGKPEWVAKSPEYHALFGLDAEVSSKYQHNIRPIGVQ